MRKVFAKDDALASGNPASAPVTGEGKLSAPHPALAILDAIDTAVEALGVEVRGKVYKLTEQARETLV